MKLIGDKNRFGVQIDITDPINLMGYAKVWLGGNSIGTEEDLIFMSYLINGLNEIASAKEIHLNANYNTSELFEILAERLKNMDDDVVHQYLIGFGTFCDDFTVFSFLEDNEINVIWKLNGNNTPFEDLNAQSTAVNSFKIDKNEYLEIVNQVLHELQDKTYLNK